MRMPLPSSSDEAPGLRLSDKSLKTLEELRDNLPLYASTGLQIRTKGGAAAPLAFNRVQLYLHERLQEQKARTGRVRALVLKFRQGGISTYIGARFFHRAVFGAGTRVFILTHEQSATDTLFAMVDRFYRHCPIELRPAIGAANAKELVFRSARQRLRSGHGRHQGGRPVENDPAVSRLGSRVLAERCDPLCRHHAGDSRPGRNRDHPRDRRRTGSAASSMSAGSGPRPASGITRRSSCRGSGTTNTAGAVPPGFALDDEEAAYAASHGLDLEQMVWRRAKIAELKDPLLFRQEYPATAAEAFQSTGHDSYIKPELILQGAQARLRGHRCAGDRRRPGALRR